MACANGEKAGAMSGLGGPGDSMGEQEGHGETARRDFKERAEYMQVLWGTLFYVF